MSTFTRASFFVQLGIADLLFYTLPRLFSKVFVRLPRALARLVVRLCRGKPSHSGKKLLGERDIEILYNRSDCSVASAFGLVRSIDNTATAVSDAKGNIEGGSGKDIRTDAAPVDGILRHSRCPSLRYTGPLYNGHIHTIFNGLRPVWHRFEYARHLVKSGDGQPLNLDLLLPSMLAAKHKEGKKAQAAADRTASDAASVRGMFFVVPGLLNASTTNYVRNFAYQMASHGYAVAVLNYRGMGSTPLAVPRLFSATFTDDIRYVLEHYFSPAQVRAMVEGKGSDEVAAAAAAEANANKGAQRNIPLIGVGFSLGGVTLIKYASEEGKKLEEGKRAGPLGTGDGSCGNGACRLDAIIAVTSPFDLVACDDATQRRVYKMFYEKPFAAGFRKFVKHNQQMIEALPNVDGAALFHGKPPLIKSITSIRVFDELINAHHNGFATPREYYAAANSIPWLAHCKTPCVCLSNRGDPVTGPAIPSEKWDREVVQRNPNVMYVCFPVGGHLGFVGRPCEEVSGKANAMERFVLDSVTCFMESVEAGFKVKQK